MAEFKKQSERENVTELLVELHEITVKGQAGNFDYAGVSGFSLFGRFLDRLLEGRGF